jgi:hypothetical protein
VTTLARLSRSATACPRSQGVWSGDKGGGTLLQEESATVFSYVAEAALATNALSRLYRTLSRIVRQANQGAIGLVIDGKYCGIIHIPPDLVVERVRRALNAS